LLNNQDFYFLKKPAFFLEYFLKSRAGKRLQFQGVNLIFFEKFILTLSPISYKYLRQIKKVNQIARMEQSKKRGIKKFERRL